MNKMKKAIIHISDLHVSTHLDPNGDVNSTNILSYFITSQTDKSDAFLESIFKIIKSDFANTDFYLLITGDLSDKAKIDEFTEVSRILNKFSNSLNISKEKILIIPGDHDVNWVDCSSAHENNNPINKKSYEFHDEKFKKYNDFYTKFFENENLKFNANSAICGEINISTNIMIVGLNSNFKIGAMSGEGYIEIETLKIEFENLLQKNIGKEIFVAFHHNMEAKYQKGGLGNWNSTNLTLIKEYLQNKDVKVFFYGNEHTSFSIEEDGILYQSAVGTLSKKHIDVSINSFKIYELDEVDGFAININLYNYQPQNSEEIISTGYWQKIDNSSQEKKSFIIKAKSSKIKEEKKSNYSVNKKSDQKKINNEYIYEEQINYSESLFKLVKDKKIFHSGHFHWSETSRAHNWIDVTKILNNYQDLAFAKNAIQDLVSKNLGENFDIIIGLGIEGNILATDLSIKKDKPYLFLPYSYRYEDHNKFEQEIFFENDGKYKSVLIITDVVNNGRTIRKLIHKEGRAVDFFKKVEKINVVSLFYTGEELNLTANILNLTEKITGDHIEDRIDYYFVTHMKVEPCPYGENYKTACLIMNNPGLGCIHKFYNDKKYL